MIEVDLNAPYLKLSSYILKGFLLILILTQVYENLSATVFKNAPV